MQKADFTLPLTVRVRMLARVLSVRVKLPARRLSCRRPLAAGSVVAEELR